MPTMLTLHLSLHTGHLPLLGDCLQWTRNGSNTLGFMMNKWKFGVERMLVCSYPKTLANVRSNCMSTQLFVKLLNISLLLFFSLSLSLSEIIHLPFQHFPLVHRALLSCLDVWWSHGDSALLPRWSHLPIRHALHLWRGGHLS